MAESVYKVIELVGTSTESWEKAAAAAIKRASKTIRDLRVAEVSQLDMAHALPRFGRVAPPDHHPRTIAAERRISTAERKFRC